MSQIAKYTILGIGTLFALLLLGAVVGAISWVNAAEGAALLFAFGMGMLIIGRIRGQMEREKERDTGTAEGTHQERFGLNAGLAISVGIGAEAVVALLSDEYVFRGYGIGFGMMLLGVVILLDRFVQSVR